MDTPPRRPLRRFHIAALIHRNPIAFYGMIGVLVIALSSIILFGSAQRSDAQTPCDRCRCIAVPNNQ